MPSKFCFFVVVSICSLISVGTCFVVLGISRDTEILKRGLKDVTLLSCTEFSVYDGIFSGNLGTIESKLASPFGNLTQVCPKAQLTQKEKKNTKNKQTNKQTNQKGPEFNQDPVFEGV